MVGDTVERFNRRLATAATEIGKGKRHSGSMVESRQSDFWETFRSINWNQEFLQWRILNLERARDRIDSIQAMAPYPDLVASLFNQLSRLMPNTSDPDRVLNNLDRFFDSCRSTLSTLALFDRDRTALPVLLKLFSASQFLGDLLIRDRESFDALRLTEGQPVPRDKLIDALIQETEGVRQFEEMVLALRRFKQREILRIAYGDLVIGQPIQKITEQISFLADAICEVSLRFAYQNLAKKFGQPMPRNHPGKNSESVCRYVVFGLGKLGGVELNYSSDIDLIFVYDQQGQTETGRRSNRQFFDRLAQDFTKLLNSPSPLGAAYRVDWRLRPEGSQGPMTMHADAFLRYYELKGRSWERQALVKARPIAGDLELGTSLLESLRPWIYQSHLSSDAIESMKALKRKIERKALLEGDEGHNVKTGFGGIRDIEFTIQFLQLLNGHTSQRLQTHNTLDAIGQLEAAGCLTMQEYQILHKNYCWLRTLEHRLQIMFDLQTHTIPENREEQARVAIRMGYEGATPDESLKKFEQDWQQIRELNRGILHHLLSDAFGREEGQHVPPAVDLIFDPDPEPEWADEILRSFRFADTAQALKHLNALAHEEIPFLSPRRCRHFLAAIAPDLLVEISKTPDPDHTLSRLCSVSDSLGGKGMLWELFRIHPPSQALTVKLCAACEYLNQILIRDPGMLDSLMDSLTMVELPSFDFLQQSLEQLVQNAEDIASILHAFKNDQHLRVGVRDIVGQDSIRDTHRALSDIAEVILQTATEHCLKQVIERYGAPRVGDQPCEFAILALGKLGGRQPNYHSDLDVVFLYQSDGRTEGRSGRSTTHQHFFSELGTRVINLVSSSGPLGRLYEIDCRLRPTGKSGALAVSFDEFARYFSTGSARSWERLAMCKARPIFGSHLIRRQVAHLATNAVQSQSWSDSTREELRKMRLAMQENCSSRNLKRGVGGTVDVEFVVQMLQLKHGGLSPEVLQSGTLVAAKRLAHHGYLSQDEYETLSQSYSFLRKVESRIRLMNTAARHELPEIPSELAKLAYLLGHQDVATLTARIHQYRIENRRLFEKFFGIDW